MTNPNYWSAAGLIVDIFGVFLLANDLFKGHVREWIDERQANHSRAVDRMRDSVVQQYRALPRDVYSEEAINKLVRDTEEHYRQLKSESAAQVNETRTVLNAGIRSKQWRGVWLIALGFVLQLIGALS
jgi:hypothetical protein